MHKTALNLIIQAELFSKWLLGNDLKKGEIVMVAGVADLDYLSALLGTVSIGCICQTVRLFHYLLLRM